MDTFAASPAFFRVPIEVLDLERVKEWEQSEDLTAPPPTKVQIFVVYIKGPGTPVPVQIEVDNIETEYAAEVPTEEDYNTLSANQYSDKWRRCNMLLRRNLLLAIVRGLDPDSANILAHEDNKDGRELLVRGGWIAPRPELETDEVVENKEEGEEVQVDETGE